MKYDKPLLIDFATEDKAEGVLGSCKSGASAAACKFGSSVGGPATGKCMTGSVAQGRCEMGATAAGRCKMGSSVRGK